MLFNSFEFLIFLPIVFLIYWFLCPNGKTKNIFLIFASYIFYGWWDIRFLLLIIGITAIAFFSGIYIDKNNVSNLKKNLVFIIALIFDIITLFLFKYFNFFVESFSNVLNIIGFTADFPTLNIILPVGISFYTFQAASYVIDVRRKQFRATKDAAAFFVFICFFPQLVAGPIERASNILPQFMKSKRVFTYENGVSGMKLILWGLFKKMVVADNAAIVVNTIFENWVYEGTLNLWIGAILFSIQIYGDFSGYSDIAIGSARLFGINLMTNFNKPYFSRNISEFWKKWHISLTSWFRDYLYIPLGGNRKGKTRTIINTLAVFVTSGLWHGANFTYIAWGAYHAVLYIPSRFVNKHKRQMNSVPIYKESIYMFITFFLVVMGWIIFRAESIYDAFGYINDLFSNYRPTSDIKGKTALIWVLILMILEWFSRKKETPFNFPNKGFISNHLIKWSICVLMFMITLLFAGKTQEFIYFKF